MWDRVLRVVALLAGLALALIAWYVGVLIVASGHNSHGVMVAVTFAPAVFLLVGALLSPFKPGHAVVAFFVAGVLGFAAWLGMFSFALFFPAPLLVPPLLAE